MKKVVTECVGGLRPSEILLRHISLKKHTVVLEIKGEKYYLSFKKDPSDINYNLMEFVSKDGVVASYYSSTNNLDEKTLYEHIRSSPEHYTFYVKS